MQTTNRLPQLVIEGMDPETGRFLIRFEGPPDELLKVLECAGEICNLKPITEPEPRPCVVVVINKPDNWNPASTSDIPPGLGIHRLESRAEATGFVEEYNSDELGDPIGKWAVAVPVYAGVYAQ